MRQRTVLILAALGGAGNTAFAVADGNVSASLGWLSSTLFAVSLLLRSAATPPPPDHPPGRLG